MPRLRHALAGSSAYLLYVLIVLIAVITAVNPRFFSGENFLAILRSSAYSGIFAIGFLFVLLSGGLDVSFAAVATVGQYLVGLVLIHLPWMPWPLVILLPMIIGVLLGSLNATLIHWLNAPPLIITIAMMNVLYGFLQYASSGTWLYNFPAWFAQFPLTLVVSFVNQDGVQYGLSILTVIWFAVALCAALILSQTKVGRRLYALGGNLEAARRAGINILRYRLFAYGFLGFTAGLGGLIHTFVTQTVAPNTLIGSEFNVVAAVVLGGASIFGGSGSVGGTLLGVILIAVLSNALTIMRVPAYWHQLFIGAILIASMAITAASERRARTKDRIRHVG
jgi:simple sugar transport system permease protein